jgi:hypothetical protein
MSLSRARRTRSLVRYGVRRRSGPLPRTRLPPSRLAAWARPRRERPITPRGGADASARNAYSGALENFGGHKCSEIGWDDSELIDGTVDELGSGNVVRLPPDGEAA